MISVIIPSTGRPQQLRVCVERLLESIEAHEVEVITVIEHDPASADALADLPVQVISRDEHRGPVYGWNEGAAAACGEYLVLGADDLVFHDGWIDAAMDAMRELDGFGMVGLNDGAVDGNKLATHYMVSRRYAIEAWGGVLCVPHYKHYYLDVEAINVAVPAGRYRWAAGALATHMHPSCGNAPEDDTHRLGRPHMTTDSETYRRRAAVGFPVDYDPIFKEVQLCQV